MILEAKDQLESNTFAEALAEAYDSLFINADVLGMLEKRNYADFLNRDSDQKLKMVANQCDFVYRSEVSILWTPANLPIR
jgi:hypothetical protein